MNRILVTGANGQLGSELSNLADLYEYEFFFTDVSELDISNEVSVNEFLNSKEIDTIINCAAYTAVDKAESETELADLINHQAVNFLAKAIKSRNGRIVHISTDYVFSGTHFSPYPTDFHTEPQNVYGKTKLAGEQALLKVCPDNSIIIRTSWVYSEFGSNFVKTMLRLGQERDQLNVIDDQVGSPTYARDLAKCILDIIPNLRHSGVEIQHYRNEGVCSWYDFAKAIMEMAEVNCRIKPIPTSQYPTPASRPAYSILSTEKMKSKFEVNIPYWRDSLAVCLKKLS
jgi:dTDP-4-dehydrorhamnose reductase